MFVIKNRAAALLVIFLIYILAAFCGIHSYNYFAAENGLALSYPFAIFFADVVATVVVFIFSLIFGNASVYDPYWSVQPPVILIALASSQFSSVKELLSFLGVENGVFRINWFSFDFMIIAAVLFWAIRLTANWIYNFKSFEYQDWRYVMLKEKSGHFYGFINFMGIHLFPTCVVFLCVLPAATAIVENVQLTSLSYVFIMLSFAAVIFQGIADVQMHQFRNSGVGGFIRTGLWKHARHPNYACEILMWWGVGLASVTALGGKYWLLAGALINSLMFIFVSVPLADQRQSRKPGFEEYKKETRMFI